MTIGKPTLSDKTVNRYLPSLGKVCKWLEDSDYIADGNLTSGQFLEIDKTKQKVFPFSHRLAQIAQLEVADLREIHGVWCSRFARPSSWSLNA